MIEANQPGFNVSETEAIIFKSVGGKLGRQALRRIKRWKSVEQPIKMHPDGDTGYLRLLYCIDNVKPEQAESLVKQLRARPGVEFANIAGQRTLQVHSP